MGWICGRGGSVAAAKLFGRNRLDRGHLRFVRRRGFDHVGVIMPGKNDIDFGRISDALTLVVVAELVDDGQVILHLRASSQVVAIAIAELSGLAIDT